MTDIPEVNGLTIDQLRQYVVEIEIQEKLDTQKLTGDFLTGIGAAHVEAEAPYQRVGDYLVTITTTNQYDDIEERTIVGYGFKGRHVDWDSAQSDAWAPYRMFYHYRSYSWSAPECIRALVGLVDSIDRINGNESEDNDEVPF